MTALTRITVAIAALHLAACGGGGDATSDAITAIDGAAPDTLAVDARTCGVVPSYTGSAVGTVGVFDVDYDDNGPREGDPLVGNDALFATGRLDQTTPPEALFIELYEGYTQFASEIGGVRDFASIPLPFTIDVGASAVDQDYGTCGACFSLFTDATFDAGGNLLTSDVHLFAASGTVTVTSLPAGPDETLELTFNSLRLTERDTNGAPIAGGCTTLLDGVTLSVPLDAMPAPRTQRAPSPLTDGRREFRSRE